ncbi:hypothetical protein TWF730_008894 [Orbilia blumenaviensis]|uniref:Uncharacterized protein n=1 Tax=Orbilia blumenaviensis TaxID=1796055 RepID=A0AAV9V035_9PEZI
MPSLNPLKLRHPPPLFAVDDDDNDPLVFSDHEEENEGVHRLVPAPPELPAAFGRSSSRSPDPRNRSPSSRLNRRPRLESEALPEPSQTGAHNPDRTRTMSKDRREAGDL